MRRNVPGRRRLSQGRGERGVSATAGESPQPLALATLLPQGRFFVADDILATGVHDVADACSPGDVFVARATAEGDGHDDVKRALARGVAGIVAERMLPTRGVPLCVVPDATWSLARLHQAFAGEPSRQMRVIAIAGTSGKTTTAWLTAAVLAEAGQRVGVLSDLGCLGPDDDRAEPARYDHPRLLAGRLARLASAGCSHAVVEVSSSMLAAHALAGVECDTVVVTNLATAHLDAHGTRSAYQALTARSVAALRRDGVLVCGARAAGLARLERSLTAGGRCLTAGLADDCDLRATAVEGGLFGRTVLMNCGGQMVAMACDTPVVSFVRNSLLAAAVGDRYGISLDIAVRGIESAGSVPGRVERIDRGQEPSLFIDSPTSGHALASTLSSLRRLTPGRLVVIAEEPLVEQIGGEAFGPLVARHCDGCVVAPTTVLAEDPGEADIAAYARIDRLLESLGPDDCGLVLGGLSSNSPSPDAPTGRFPLAMLVNAWLQIAQAPDAGIRHAA